MRIMVALALLGDQLLQYLPRLAEFYGPEGVAPAGLHDAYQLKTWQVSVFFFSFDNLNLIYAFFGLWVAVAVGFLVGWQTRWMNVLLWLLTRCFMERNPNLLYGADYVLQIALFLLVFAPSGAALSMDAWMQRRQGQLVGPALVPPWSLRLIQIELCLIYCTSGLAKLKGHGWDAWLSSVWEIGIWSAGPPPGTWWDGTAIHYVLNDTTMGRWAFAEFPLPLAVTAAMTYLTVWWEVLFPLLVLNRWTRHVALILGVLFHIGILVTVDIGWFGFYMLSLYAVWTPDKFWRRFDKTPSAPLPVMAVSKVSEKFAE